MLRDLVLAMDDENGVSKAMYDAIDVLTQSLMGIKAANAFARYADATEGRFYIKEGQADACWLEMCEAAKHEAVAAEPLPEITAKYPQPR